VHRRIDPRSFSGQGTERQHAFTICLSEAIGGYGAEGVMEGKTADRQRDRETERQKGA